MKTAALAAALVALALAGPAAAQGRDADRALVKDYLDLVYAKHQVQQAFDKYVAPDFIEHNPNIPDRATAFAFLSSPGYQANPHEIVHLAVDADLAMVHFRSTNPTTRQVTAVVDIYRLAHGKIVEHWDVVQRAPEDPKNPRAMF